MEAAADPTAATATADNGLSAGGTAFRKTVGSSAGTGAAAAVSYSTPPAHAWVAGKCPETTMPMGSGSQAHLGYPNYEGVVDSYKYKRSVNEQGVALGADPDYSGHYARAPPLHPPS
mmetsp:Transcript_17198/g.31628  ORF Transcript_17198/g.31628 Transcript_17198/m.31628 type:complete len:117 (-) Transcript_17198:122-472(-)